MDRRNFLRLFGAAAATGAAAPLIADALATPEAEAAPPSIATTPPINWGYCSMSTSAASIYIETQLNERQISDVLRQYRRDGRS